MAKVDEAILFALSAEVGRLALANASIITAAESCTGGGIAYWLTATAGSSQWFEHALVTYAESAKQRLLNIPAILLQQYGVVSAACVEAMVRGACDDSHDVAVATSGVAGPTGGSLVNPIGTVWIAWGDQHQQYSQCFHFTGNRQIIRQQAIYQALAGLVDYLRNFRIS